MVLEHSTLEKQNKLFFILCYFWGIPQCKFFADKNHLFHGNICISNKHHVTNCKIPSICWLLSLTCQWVLTKTRRSFLHSAEDRRLYEMNDRAMSFAVNLFLKTKQRIDYYITTLKSILCSKYILLFTFSLPTILYVGEHVWESVCMCVCAHVESVPRWRPGIISHHSFHPHYWLGQGLSGKPNTHQ